jgi:hypothetical protein
VVLAFCLALPFIFLLWLILPLILIFLIGNGLYLISK